MCTCRTGTYNNVTYLQDNLLGSYLVISRVWGELLTNFIDTDSLMIGLMMIRKRPAKKYKRNGLTLPRLQSNVWESQINY